MKWRVGPAVRDWLVLLAWSALGFGGVVFWEGVQTSSPEKPNLARGLWTNANEPAARASQARRATREAHAGSPGTTAQSPAPTALADARASHTADLTSGDHPPARDDATLTADAPASPDPSPESIRTLAETLTTDPDTHHRIRAITELRSLAEQGHEVSTVRDTLRLASADDDADVAERAKDAYDDLIQTLD
jgi:hypothetical protein